MHFIESIYSLTVPILHWHTFKFSHLAPANLNIVLFILEKMVYGRQTCNTASSHIITNMKEKK